MLIAGLFVALLAMAFWARPVSFINGYLYLRLWLAGGRSRSVTVNGIRVHYDVAGTAGGDVVVLVHGLGGHAEDWLYVLPYLLRAGFRVYMIDLPGFGRSERPATFSYSIEDQAAVVSSFLDVLDLRQANLGGWSMGGWIVQHAAFARPERLRKLILINSAGLNEEPSWNTSLFAPKSVAELRELEALLTPRPPWAPNFVRRDYVRVSRTSDWVIRRALASMLGGVHTTDAILPKLRLPVLILWDEEDRIFPVRHARTMHELIPGSQLEIVSGSGHLVVILGARQIAPKLVDFLKRSG